MPAEGASFTNHPGVIDFGGKSLFFYHNGALPGGGGYKRSVSVEEFTYGMDGSIPQLRMTEDGASAVASLNPFERVEAETIAWNSGVETEICNEAASTSPRSMRETTSNSKKSSLDREPRVSKQGLPQCRIRGRLNFTSTVPKARA